jgi:gamma-glutamyltranspeptidase
MAYEQGAAADILDTGRSPAMGLNGAVASPHYLASQVGLEI